MIYKNILLVTVLTISTFTFNLNALETTDSDSISTTVETDQLTAAKIAADTIVEIAKIKAAAEIEAAKITAAASENFGLEVAKIWAPILGTAICLLVVLQLR